MKKTIPVIGMACSVCSANVEKKLQSLEGINSASVSLASRTALVDYDPDIISLEDMKRGNQQRRLRPRHRKRQKRGGNQPP